MELKANTFLSADDIYSILVKQIDADLDKDMIEYCNAYDYYEPYWEEFVGEGTYDSEDKRKNSFEINNDSPSKRGGNRIENVQTHIAPNIGHKEGKTSKNV